MSLRAFFKNWITRAMFNKQEILCPFCLRDISATDNKCSGCQRDLPQAYRRGYDPKRVFVLSAIGFTGHGKTVYLAALLHELDHLAEIWPNFFREALNLESVHIVREHESMLKRGELPKSTQSNFPEPSIHRLASLPYFGDRRMLIYDAAGETFDNDEKYGAFISRAHTALFFVSLFDLLRDNKEDDVSGEMHRLLNTYRLGMVKLNSNTRHQHLVVVYTKGDEERIGDMLTKYPEAADMLRRGELRSGLDIERHLREMEMMSRRLADFTERRLGAHNFVNLAKREFASIEYCLVSSLGQPPEKDNEGNAYLKAAIAPRRVLDPLLWVIQKSEPDKKGRFPFPFWKPRRQS